MDLRPTLASLLLLACGYDHPPTTYLAPETPVAVADARPLGRDDAPADVALPIITHEGRRWVILASMTDDEPGVGPVRLLTRRDIVVTERAPRPEAIPPRWRVAPTTVRVHDRGASCTLRLAAPTLLSRFVPDMTLLDAWNGVDGEGNRTTPPRDEEIVDEAYQQAGGGRVLAAEVLEGGCGTAPWAHLTPRAPTGFHAERPDAALQRAAVAAYRETDAWRETQGVFRDYPDERPANAAADPRWDEHNGNAPEVTLWRASRGTRSFVTVRGRVPFEGCGIFSGAVWAVYERVGDRLVSRGATTAGDFEVAEAVDVDGDGAPEFFGGNEIRALGPSGYEVAASSDYPVHGCRC